MDSHVVVSPSARLSLSHQDFNSFISPPNLPAKRLSIFLPSTTKRNSIMPFPEEEMDQSQTIFQRKNLNKRLLTYTPIQSKTLQVRRMDSANNGSNTPTSPYLSTNLMMMESRKMSFVGDIEEKSEFLDPSELDLRTKDAEERKLLYQQIAELIIRDDNADFFKRGILLDDENEQENFWKVDFAEEYQKEADAFSKIQEGEHFLYCERKNPFELIKMYADPYPLLELRKVLAYMSRKFSLTCLQIIRKPWFDNLVLFIILWNCVLLAIEDPTKTATNEEAQMEQILLICYSIEMCLKIIGLGFICPKGAYLRDGWNVLDFIIIVTSYLPYIFSGDNSFKFSSLRTLRVLRPLRTISSVKSLKNLLVTLFSSMPLLLDILLFLLFFFVSFAMIGVHLFAGTLKNRCFFMETGLMESDTEVCGYQPCSSESFCGKGLDNPYYGVMNFDNILFSFVMGFQCVTLQAWTVIMVEVIKSYSIFVIFYFISLVFFGSFFLLNLTLAVIKSKFTDTQKLKEILGKAMVKKLGEVQINELKVLKRMERSHFKRMKNQKPAEQIGASEEGRPGTNRFNEITWDDLLQLKEMIREERLREEEEERFDMLRRERVRSDDMEDEKKLGYYIRKVQELKRKALQLFLKSGTSMGLVKQGITDRIKSAKVHPVFLNKTGKRKGSLEGVKKETRILIHSPNIPNDKEKEEECKVQIILNQDNNESNTNDCTENKDCSPNSARRKTQGKKDDKFRKSLTLNPRKATTGNGGIRSSKVHPSEPEPLEILPISSRIRGNSRISPEKSPKTTEAPQSKSNLKNNKVLPLPDSSSSSMDSNGQVMQLSSAYELNNLSTLQETSENNIVIEDPAVFLNSCTQQVPKSVNTINLSIRDLKSKNKKHPQVTVFRRQSLTSMPSLTIIDSMRFTQGFNNILVKPILEEAENEDLEPTIEKVEIGSIQLPPPEGIEAIIKNKDPAMLENDLLNDSDFNDSLTLNKAKLEAILQDKRGDEREVEKQTADAENTEEIDGLETLLSERPFLGEKGNNENPQLKSAQLRSSQSEEKLQNTNTLGLKTQTSGASILKRGTTLRNKKHTNQNKIHKMLNFSLKKSSKNNPQSPPERRANIRDFNLMVDMEKVYKSFSQDDVLENRIIMLAEQQKQKERDEIAKQKFKIELKPSSFKSFNREVLEQIKDNRKKVLMMQSIGKRNFRIALRTTWVFQDNRVRPPTIILRRQFIPQGSFLKSSLPKSPKKVGSSKKKKVALKLDDDLEFKYESIALKIAESMITKGPADAELDREIEEEYLGIHRQDKKNKMKREKVWSGSSVLPMKIFQGYWSFEHINRLFRDLSFSKQDRVIWVKGIRGKFKILHKYIKRFLNGPIFEKTLLLIVIFNTIMLCIDGLFTDETTLSIQNTLFYFFNILFVIEFGVKFFIFGPASSSLLNIFHSFKFLDYLRDIMNIFDGLVATTSLLELTIVGSGGFAFIKVFRVLRVARLLRSIEFMRMIVNIVSRALKSFIYIALLLLLFLFIYSLLGMQLFGGAFQSRYQDLSIEYRENFDTFVMAFITAFQILTSTAWQHLLYLSYGSSANIYLTVLYIISWIFIGNYVLLNLFLAIILDEFTKDENYVIQNEETFDYAQEILVKENIATAATSQTQLRMESSMDPPSPTTNSAKKSEKKKIFHDVECQNSLWLFSKHNKVRIICYKMTLNQKVENFWLVVIVANAIKMIVDTYFINSQLLNAMDIVFFCFFATELIIKVISFGLVMEKGSYLRDYWNILDFIIVIFNLIDLSVESLNFNAIKGFRVLRMLRPLRLISHNVNMKIVVTALLDSITSIFNILIIILLIWLMFAILGMSLLKGKMGRCDIKEEYYHISFTQCIEEGKEWVVWDTNFDNIYNALITLFVISSRELWADIMYLCIDAGDQSEGPSKDHYPQMQVYFIAFILIGSYFLLNLLVGVIFYNFNKAKRNEQNKSLLFLTEEQAKWLNIQKMIAQVKPDFLSLRKPKNPVRLRAFQIVTHRHYEKVITFLITINTIIMALYHDPAPLDFNYILDNFTMVFQILYVLEVVLKILGLGFKAYWYDSWNKYDFFLTCFSIIDVTFWSQDIRSLISPIIFVFEIFRILRILRLLKIFKGLQKLLETLLFSLPPLINVGALLLLIIFIYAILGVSLFSNILHGEVVDEYNNFKNFGFAMLVLFKVMTGDEWFHIMFDLYHKPAGCEETNTCGSVASIFYFVSFFLICAYIMLNLFILIIIQQFEDFHLKEDNPITNFKRNLESFSQIWAKFTEASFGITINSKKLIDFYMNLDPPLGFGINSERPKVALEIMKMNLQGDEEGNIYFNELLFASMKRVFGQEILNNVSKEIKEMMENQEKQIKARLERRTMRMLNSFYAESPATRPRSVATSMHASPLKPNTNKQIVNPMITILFVGMVFKSWKRWTEHFNNEELDSDGSVIRVKYENEDSEEDDDEEESEEEDDGGDVEKNENESQEEKNDEGVYNESSNNGSSSSEDEEEEEEDDYENEDQQNEEQKTDKQKVALNMIGKFINKKKKAEDETTDENNFQRRKSRNGNMFRTFFASNESKVRLQKN